MFSFREQGILRCDALLAFPWLEHGFQTRHTASLPVEFAQATLRQIHSNHVVVADGATGPLGEGDALVTATPGVLLTIRTADCVPLLVADPTHRVTAAIHAGWRGVVAGVIPQTVEAMQRKFGCAPEELLVAIGPCIRRDSFEVGAEVAVAFREIFPERNDLERKTTVDLAEACIRQLTGLRVPRERVFDCGLCTFRGADQFHSFRRDREDSGRMTAFAGIRKPE